MLKPALTPTANVAMEQLTVPPFPTPGFVHVNDGPEVCDSATKVAPDGRGSLSVTVAASLGPVFVSVRLYVMLFPDANVAGPLFVTTRSAEVEMVDIADAELFPGVGSGVVLLTLAVFVIVEPLASLARTLSARLNVAVAALAKFAIVHVIAPVPPAAGVVQLNVGPALCVSDANDVPTGTLSVSVTVC